jgi:transcription antitermination factor NusG
MIDKKQHNNLCWYVLYTSPRAEKQVRERITLQNVECFLPLHRTPRAWSDRVKMVDVPLFHSYIFVRCHESQLYSLLSVYGVSRIVYYNGKPAIIRQKEIDAIKDFLQQSANHELLVGDEVEILAGAMKNVSGKVRKIKKTYLVLYLEQLGATVSVNLQNVAPANRLK